ncbi:Ig-like domain-containing protein [Shewanella metallivivens]|uniref:Ig-like domain-containing protein n=1 Tax=Shewanella metallivivens TaxID=2872342 RepID=A0ABT5TNQ3_9GAMM|nr:Ig-like domain-containing protein [Shewanella metallivivens]MDD8060232.1 Ig-like domain-containing protein [Shewanella metallivivens]
MQLETTIRALFLSIASILLFTGCNGAADGTDSDTSDDSYSLSVSYQDVVNGQCDASTDSLIFDLNDSVCAVAKLTLGNANVSGALIEFTSSNATLSNASVLTDTSGIATTFITSTSTEAGTLTATYTSDDDDSVSDSRNYQFKEYSTTAPAEALNFTVSISDSSGVITRFNVGDTVQLNAQLTDSSNQGIANQIVTFNAGSATLSPATALTTDAGIATLSFTPTDSELGASQLTATAEYEDTTLTATSAYEVLASTDVTTDGTVMMGSYDDSGEFIENLLATTLTADTEGSYTISAGGSFGVTATLVTEAIDGTITRLQSPISISFSSDCTTNDNATLDTPVTTVAGSASSTFSDTSCSGNSESTDTIVASATVNDTSLSASLPFTLARQTLSNISFVSADPTQIRIKGSGGTDTTESSLVTFLVSSANGQPAAQQEVEFSLDTTVGGLQFSNGDTTDSSITNSEGLVSVRVQAGTIPTPVRVMASTTDADTGDTITSQSEQLTVNTGLPQQLGFSISASTSNPEAGDYNGEDVTITVYASDSFGNPAPDDTTVNFTTEGGQIEPSCSIVSGSCTVTWTSASPRVTDHRITILAYALGHETFFDTNGNNVFDDEDGSAVNGCLIGTTSVACSGNGMDVETYQDNGFVDLPDAFRDDDESGERDSGEPYFNTKSSSTYQGADGVFNGPQCQGSLCDSTATTTYIRKALVLTMSGSTASFTVSQNGSVINDFDTDIQDIANGGSSIFTVVLSDSADQILPSGTTLSVSSSEGELTFSGYTVPDRNSAGGTSTSFMITNDDNSGTSLVTLTATTPKGVVTELSFFVTLL